MLALTLAALLTPQDLPPAPPPPPAADPARLERTVRDLVGFGTRHVLSSTAAPDRGTGAARAYLERCFEACIPASGGRLKVRRESYTVAARRLRMDRLEVVNIVAELPGTTDPERVYVVSGHYDSRNRDGGDGERDAPGANDDGSGTALVVEVCRLLCEREFPSTILFVCYDGEEQGLLGSTAHAAQLEADGLFVDGMLNNDIVGNSLGVDGVRRDGVVRCFSYAPRGNDSLGRSLARAASWAARRVAGLDVKLVFRGDRYGRGGDHRPFFQAGWPAVRFSEPREDYSRQHQDVTERDGQPYGDLPDFVDFDYLARVTTLDAALLGELAAAPRAPGRVRVEGVRDRYATRVNFGAVDGAAGYEVLWRDTTAPDWEHARAFPADELRFEGRSESATVTLDGVCIDDVVVAVRTIAEDGSRSRATAAPEPDAMAFRNAAEGR